MTNLSPNSSFFDDFFSKKRESCNRILPFSKNNHNNVKIFSQPCFYFPTIFVNFISKIWGICGIFKVQIWLILLTRGLLFNFFSIPNVFSSSSPKVHQVLIVFPNMFPIVPYFCPICFAQSCLLFTYHIRWGKEGALHLLVETSILWSLHSNFLQTFKDEMIILKSQRVQILMPFSFSFIFQC